MNRRRQDQRGMTVPMVALFIVCLFAMAALALDLGVLYTARTSAQHAADAAALAGAFTFLNPIAPQPATATGAATTIGQRNHILRQQVAISEADVNVDVPNRRVTVTVPRTGADGIVTYFARVMGINQADVVARATAEAARNGTGSRCLKPIYVPNTVLSTKDPAEACDPANRETLFDGNGQLTAFAQQRFGVPMPIRPSNPQNALAPGQFYSLDFGSGANTYECAIANCLNQCDVAEPIVRCGQAYPLKTGNMVGPTRQGIDTLIGDPPDEWVNVGEYRDGDTGLVKDTSNSVVVTPVWDNCTQTVSPGYAGQQVRVIGFLNMFVDGMVGQNVQARMVTATPCATSGGGAGEGSEGGPTGANTGPWGVPVRLVQTPQ
jgi:hypothetical protein